MLNSLFSNIKTAKLLPTIVLCSIFSSTHIYASDSCHIKLDAGLTLTTTTLEFFNATKGSDNNKKILYKIQDDQRLIVHDKEVSLTSQQQRLVTQYARSVRAMVPQVRSVASEGVDLALEGVNRVFNDLLGEGNSTGAELTRELSTLRDEALTRFTPERGITIDEYALENKVLTAEKMLGKQFKQRVELVMEKAVVNAMGNLVVVMGQEMLLSGKQGRSFEARIKSFRERAANEKKIRTKQIEQKTDALCVPVVNIAQLEDRLQTNISSLKNLNVLSARLKNRK